MCAVYSYVSVLRLFVWKALLKKHEALMSDLEAYRSIIDGLQEQAQACKVFVRLKEVMTTDW